MKNSTLESGKNLVKHWYAPLVAGILFILLGIWVLNTPVASFVTLAMFFSIFLFISGISEVFFAISNRNELDHWVWTMVLGLMNIFIGYILISHPLLTSEFLALYIGFLVLFRSISAIGAAIDLKRYHESGWGMMLFLAILGIIFSIILIQNPLFAGLSTVIWVALGLIVVGVYSIYFSLQLRKIHKLA